VEIPLPVKLLLFHANVLPQYFVPTFWPKSIPISFLIPIHNILCSKNYSNNGLSPPNHPPLNDYSCFFPTAPLLFTFRYVPSTYVLFPFCLFPPPFFLSSVYFFSLNVAWHSTLSLPPSPVSMLSSENVSFIFAIPPLCFNNFPPGFPITFELTYPVQLSSSSPFCTNT